MSKNKVFQWILYFPSQKILFLKKMVFYFFLENFKISRNNLFSVEAALEWFMVLFWCLMQCWIRWIHFNIGRGKKEFWKRISAAQGCIPRHCKISSNLGKCKGYIWVAKLSIQAKGICDLQNYESGQRVYLICKSINLGKGYIWFAKLSIWAKEIYDLQNYQSGQRSWM